MHVVKLARIATNRKLYSDVIYLRHSRGECKYTQTHTQMSYMCGLHSKQIPLCHTKNIAHSARITIARESDKQMN